MGVLSPDGGEVLWDGRPITAADRRQLRLHARGARPLPQADGARPARLPRPAPRTGAAAAKASVTSHLERLGLADRAKDHVEKLSLGNQQRVQIIAALHGPARAPSCSTSRSAASTRRPSTPWPTCCASTPRAACRCSSPPTSSTSSSGSASASSCWPAAASSRPGTPDDLRAALGRAPPARAVRRRRLGARRRAASTPSTSTGRTALLEVVEHGAERTSPARRRCGAARCTSSPRSGRAWPRSTVR